MKHNILKSIYECLKQSSIIQITNGLKWIIIFKPKDTNQALGLSERGTWVVFSNDLLFVLKEYQSYLYAMWLLEYEFNDIIKNNEKLRMCEPINSELNSVSSDIIEFALKNNNSSYWLNLAFEWYDQLNQKYKTKFKELLKDLMTSNNLSQDSRHKAKRRYFELQNS